MSEEERFVGDPDSGDPGFDVPDSGDADEAEEGEEASAFARLELTPEILDQLLPVPEILHSDYREGPFTQCNICDRLLDEGIQPYHVEKVFRGTECVFEAVLCAPCAEKLNRQYSRESRRALRDFFLAHYEPSLDISSCHLCRGPAVPGEDRVLAGICARDRLVLPIVVCCSRCQERSQELLSARTREMFRDFIETHFPGVPAEWEPVPSFVL